MATKKAVKKPARQTGGKAVKSAKPVTKTPSKQASKTTKKPLQVKTAKPSPKKALVKKMASPAKKGLGKQTPAKKPPVKHTKSTAIPVKKNIPKKTASSKPAPKSVKAIPSKKVEPVRKPAVAAPSHKEVKPAIKPLQQTPVVKKEAPKPSKPIAIPKTSTTKSVKYEPEFTKSVLDKYKREERGPTMRYSDAELTEFRDLINRKLDTAKKELAYLQGLITRKDESGDLDEGRYMTMEDGSMSMEREQLSQMASRQIQFIDHLEKAIMRIENKTYGICRITGKLIDKARLRAVPHATLSIEAKQMMNK
jgi:RNA polymerase-binding transcription factor DksA